MLSNLLLERPAVGPDVHRQVPEDGAQSREHSRFVAQHRNPTSRVPRPKGRAPLPLGLDADVLDRVGSAQLLERDRHR